MNKTMHSAPRGFGASGFRWIEQVADIMCEYTISTVLDYGCGRGTLVQGLKQIAWASPVTFYEYDPCVVGKDIEPQPAELVTCTDVLEHIELKYLDEVLLHLEQLTKRVIFFNIAMHRANKILPDGRNAHLIQRPRTWWMQRMSQYFIDCTFCEIKSKPGREDKDFNFYLVRPS